MPDIPEQVFIDCEGQTGVALPHPDSCEFFFFCVDNRSFLQVCGIGLVFDILSGQCQTPQNGLCILDVPTVPTEEPTEEPPTEEPPTEAPPTEEPPTEEPPTEEPPTEEPPTEEPPTDEPQTDEPTTPGL